MRDMVIYFHASGDEVAIINRWPLAIIKTVGLHLRANFFGHHRGGRILDGAANTLV
jgi:hypothetical protein